MTNHQDPKERVDLGDDIPPPTQQNRILERVGSFVKGNRRKVAMALGVAAALMLGPKLCSSEEEPKAADEEAETENTEQEQEPEETPDRSKIEFAGPPQEKITE